MLLGVTSLFEMYPPFMHVDLVASLCTLGSRGTIWMQTDRLYQFLKYWLV